MDLSRERRVLERLSWHVWQTGLELVKKGAGNRWVVYWSLGRLERGGLVVSRLRERTSKAFGLYHREYRLTEKGLRCRLKRDQEGSLNDVLVPQGA